MYRKIQYPISFIIVLGLVLTSTASADLVGHWKLDETSGATASDSSGNGLDGTLQGDITWVAGKLGGAWLGNGSNQYIDMGDDAATGGLLDLSGAGQATITAWINMATSKNHNAILTKGEWKDSYSLTIKGDTSPANMLWTGNDTSIFSSGTISVGEWMHVAVTINGTLANFYINGVLSGPPNQDRGGPIDNNPADHVEIGREDRSDNGSSARWYFDGMLDDVRVYNEALPAEMISLIMTGYGGSPGLPQDPSPADGATDVLRDSVLSWTPGEFADKHDVYFGTNFDDVNNADVSSPLLLGPAQDAETYDPGRLEFSQDYFWRIDEINAPPDNTVFKGNVWTFKVEPLAIPIPGESITASASSQVPDQGPEKTIDGSGLVDDLHSTELTDMWQTSETDTSPVWIQYDFDKAYKLHEILIWNYNAPSLLSMIGLKDVVVEYSTDGANWNPINGVSGFAKAPGTISYAHNTTIACDGVTAQYVKITASSNWSSGIFTQYGLSEVRFVAIPVSAREPSPAIGATDVAVDVTLGWRAGREVAEHKVYISTDEQAVINGTAPAVTATDASYSPLSLDLESTYYWRVDEVNNAETPTSWQSDIWSFVTQDYRVVDDFESYNDIPSGEEGSNLVYETWNDGFNNPATNGSTIGYVTGASMESGVVQGGEQSVPLLYDNSTASKSEITVDPANLAIGRDWSIGSPQTLVLWIHGDPGNAATDRLYVKVGNAKVLYDGDIARPQWKPMIIDLAALGVNLNNVSSLSIGLERAGATGGSGVVYIDEISLYRTAPAVPAEEIWIEAEAADSITPPMMILSEIAGASGGQYISNSADAPSAGNAPLTEGVAKYNFTVMGGTYVIWGRVSVPDNAHDSFWLRIQGATVNRTVHSSGWVQWNNIPVGSDWHWDDVHSSQDGNNTVNWTLTAGMHTLEIGYRDGFLDALVITKVD